MQAVAHNADFARKVGISQSVGKKFEREDQKAKADRHEQRRRRERARHASRRD